MRNLAKSTTFLVPVLVALAATIAGASEEITLERWPLRVLERRGLTSTDVVLDGADAANLTRRERVRFERVELPDGRRVDLELERRRVSRRDVVFAIDGFRAPFAPDENVTLWRGRVAGERGSRVFLALSPHGSRGVVESAGRRYHLTARRGPDGTYESSTSRFEVALIESEAAPAFQCLEETIEQPFARQLFAPPPDDGADGPTEGSPPAESSFASTLECAIAFETDWQLYQKFGSVDALSAYVSALVGAVSAEYEDEVGVVITMAYLGVWTSSADPWTSQDSGGDAGDVLNEFRTQWSGGNAPASAHLNHFLSGANLGGGVAWLDVLCHSSYAFGVSGNLNGNLTTPVVQGGNTWDFVVVAHELGHNFGTSHTHDYCPPIDSCAPSGYFGSCQTSQVCGQGTIMSYCHTCSGGMSNIQITFGSIVADVMRDAAENSCLPVMSAVPNLVAIAATAPGEVVPGTNFTAQVRIDSTGEPIAGACDWQLRLSTDATITSADAVIASGSTSTFGASFDVTVALGSGVAHGPYRLGLTVDAVSGETALANNVHAGSSLDVVAGSGAPDLVALGVSGPSAALQGETIAIVRDVANVGGSVSSFAYDVVLSADGVISEADRVLASVSSSQFGAVQLAGIVVPLDVAPGSYTLGLIVAPVSGESATSDNTIAGDAISIASIAGVADRFVPGDSLLGSIADGLDEDGVEFDAIAGTAISFTVASCEDDQTLTLSVEDPNQQVESLGGLGESGSSTFVAGSTGTHRLLVNAGTGSGAYTLETALLGSGVVTFVNKLSAQDGKTQTLLVPAVAGAILDVVGKTQKTYKGKGLAPELTAPSETEIDLSDEVIPAGAKGFAIDGLMLGETGTHSLRVSGIKGSGKCVKVTISVAAPIGATSRLID